MQEENLDFLIAATPENVYYAGAFQSLSQWLIRGPRTPVVVIFDSAGNLTLVGPAGELDRAACNPPAVDRIIAFDSVTIELGERSTWCAEDERYAAMAIAGERPETVWDAFRQLDLHRAGKVAIDDPDLNMEFSSRFGIKTVDGRPLWQNTRLIKTPAEVSIIRRTVDITETAFRKSINSLQPGLSEREFQEIFEAELLSAGGRPWLSVIGFGTFSAYPNHVPGDYCLKKNDLIRLDIGCEYKGYVSDIARVACMGPASDFQYRRWHAILSGQQAALEVIKPGIPTAEVYRIGMEAVRRNGLSEIQRKHIGHGVGIDMYELPSISPNDSHILESGMVFELEVLFYELGFGALQVEDTIHVTDDGYERITTLPQQLYIIEP